MMIEAIERARLAEALGHAMRAAEQHGKRNHRSGDLRALGWLPAVHAVARLLFPEDPDSFVSECYAAGGAGCGLREGEGW